MIRKIKTFFDTRVKDSTADQLISDQHQVRTAAAALLVEIMVTDSLIEENEETTIKKLIENGFELSQPEAEEIYELAKQEVAEATSLYQFTGLVNEHFSAPEKFELLTQTWQVALADGTLDKYEESLIRRLADLLHIGHSQFIKAKSLAKASISSQGKTQ